MTNPIIHGLNNTFEQIKENVNNGQLPVFAKMQTEDLLTAAKEIKKEYALPSGNAEYVKEINIIIKQLTNYINELNDFLNVDIDTI